MNKLMLPGMSPLEIYDHSINKTALPPPPPPHTHTPTYTHTRKRLITHLPFLFAQQDVFTRLYIKNYKKAKRDAHTKRPLQTKEQAIGITHRGARWLGGRVLDSKSRGYGFEPPWRHCVVSLDTICYTLLSTGST